MKEAQRATLTEFMQIELLMFNLMVQISRKVGHADGGNEFSNTF